MTQIVAVSKPGINVLTATDADDFIFHSDYDTLKYETKGTKTVTLNHANYYATYDCFGTNYDKYVIGEVTHNLGYIPYFAGYLLDFPSSGSAIQAPFAFADACAYIYLDVYADATKLYFTVHLGTTQNSGTTNYNFAYRIFKNDLGL